MHPLRSRGLVCVVTDRERLCPGASDRVRIPALLDHARAAAAAGADLYQVRERGLADAPLLDLVASIRSIAAGSGMRVVVNDRLDVAVAAAADGVQLPGLGIAASEARRVCSVAFTIGVSVHGDPQDAALASRAADLAIFGTIFPTRSKPADQRWATPGALARVAAACPLPVLGIGGITAANVREVAPCCAGIAAIGWFATTDARALHEAVRLVRSVFDSVEPLI